MFVLKSRLDAAQQNAAQLSSALIEVTGKAHRLEAELIQRESTLVGTQMKLRRTLRDIVRSVDGTKAPNGTLRMIRRIAAAEGLRD